MTKSVLMCLPSASHFQQRMTTFSSPLVNTAAYKLIIFLESCS